MKLGRTRTLTPMNRLRNDPEAGQVMIMVALAAVIMFAFVGIAIDVGRLYVTKAELSRAVDAAALSGILELDGTVAGQTAAENKARSYFEDNEGGADANVDPQAIPGENEMTVDATKSVKMYFLSVIGINKVTVKAHARAGFGTQYLDVVMALDATPSMAGTPLTNAKAAAINFKNILLGDNPDGNVLVGMTPFRGCFRPVPLTLADCVDTGTQVSGLTSNSGTLDTKINAITSGATSSGASATNVCTGLAEAWNIFSGAVSGAAAHFDDDLYPNNRQYLVLLSDGDNYYYGSNTYQDPYFSGGALDSQSSPSGATVAGVGYGCQPIDASSGNVGDACPSPWNTPSISSTYPCYKGVNGSSSSIVSDNWDSNSWTGGTGWSGSWTPNTSNTSVVTTSSGSAQSGSYQLRLGRGSGVATNHATDGFESNSWTGGTGWAGNWVPSTSNTSILSTPTGSPQEGSRQLRMSRDSTATAVASDGFDSNTWTGGTGWAGDWQRNNTNSTVTSLQTTAPQAGSRTLRLGRNGTGSSNVGTVWRAVSLTGMTNAQMTYYTKRNSSFSGSADRVYVEAATNPSGTWTTLATHASTTGTGLTQTGTSWASTTVDLSSFAGQSTVYVRFRATMDNNSDQFFIDTIDITTDVAENGSIYRAVSLSGLANADFTYYTKRNSGFSGSADRVYVEAATSLAGSWTLLATHASTTGTGLTQTGTSWAATTVNLNSFAGQSTVYLRFRSTMDDNADQFYIDNVAVTTSSTVSGSIYRSFSLSSRANATLTYYAKRSSNFLSSDRVYVEATTNPAGTWTVLQTLAGATGAGLTNVGTGWGSLSVSLDDFAGDATVYIRFRGEMDNDSDQFFIDTLSITTFTSSAANGYLNGNDGSNASTCNENSRPRERQLDSRTIKLAQAIKAQGVEIFVVAFAGGVPSCNLDSTAVYNEKTAADCNAVDQSSGPVASGYSSTNGPIGSGASSYVSDTTANQRLLKCIASNTPGSNDHYYYASSSSELTSIFTKIANQISLRLIE